MLYKRDYTCLTAAEHRQWMQAEKKIKKDSVTASDLFLYYDLLPKAALHYMQLFPNNYLDIDDLKDHEKLMTAKGRLKNILDQPETGEREILNFIRDNEYFFIVGRIFLYGSYHFNFGHHAAFLFREFPLGANHIADYLLVGKNSGGYEFIFVEFESPKGAVTTKNGDFGEVIRKGISQTKDWNRWLDSNFSFLQAEFEKHLGKYDPFLPKEFYKLDKSRLHYVVVAGRRSHYNEKTYTLRRELYRENHITLMHYDNLMDLIDRSDSVQNY